MPEDLISVAVTLEILQGSHEFTGELYTHCFRIPIVGLMTIPNISGNLMSLAYGMSFSTHAMAILEKPNGSARFHLRVPAKHRSVLNLG